MKPPKLSLEQRANALEQIKQGMSINAVAEYYGVSRQYLNAYCIREQGKTVEDRTEEVKTHSRIQAFVKRAVCLGVLIPEPCEVCGIFGKTDKGRRAVSAHHDDYNYPLKVRWLCHKHHMEWHTKNNAIELNLT